MTRPKCCIYFIQCGLGGPIKIGRTWREPRKRMRAIQQGMPFALQLLGVIRNVRPEMERSLHQRFERYCLRGEWFHPHPKLLRYIADVATDHPDPSPPDEEADGLGITPRRLIERHGEIVSGILGNRRKPSRRRP